jgi:hypothetical protein
LGENVDAHDAVFARNALLTRVAKCIELLPQLDLAESHSSQNLNHLSHRESASNSASPEIDVPPDRLGQLIAHRDVRVKKATAGFENAEDLGVGNRLIRRQVEHAVRYLDVVARFV